MKSNHQQIEMPQSCTADFRALKSYSNDCLLRELARRVNGTDDDSLIAECSCAHREDEEQGQVPQTGSEEIPSVDQDKPVAVEATATFVEAACGLLLLVAGALAWLVFLTTAWAFMARLSTLSPGDLLRALSGI